MEWYRMVLNSTVWYGMVRYGAAQNGTVHGMVLNGIDDL